MPADARPPVWLPSAVAVIRRLPFGRYRLTHRLRRLVHRPFITRLSPELGGFRFHCDPRDSVAGEVCFTGWYEPQETRIVARVLTSGAVFVDVGANWSYFSLVAAGIVGAPGRVVALEPEPRLYASLTSNLAMNGLTSVTARRAAAGAGTGQTAFAAFDADSDNWGTSHAVFDEGQADFQCATAALDDLLDQEHVDCVDLVKIDVEGGELEVLDGMRRGLADGRYRYVVIECHPEALASRGTSVAECLDRLLAARYRLGAIDHSPEMHRESARAAVPMSRLMRPWTAGDDAGRWPHFFAAAPGAPDLR